MFPLACTDPLTRFAYLQQRRAAELAAKQIADLKDKMVSLKAKKKTAVEAYNLLATAYDELADLNEDVRKQLNQANTSLASYEEEEDNADGDKEDEDTEDDPEVEVGHGERHEEEDM